MKTEYTRKTLKAEDLSHFYGTAQYWSTGSRLHPFIYTDGVKHVITHGQAYWLLDVIGSWQFEKSVKEDSVLRELQFWTLTVALDNTAVIACERDTNDVVVQQEIEFTDFPLPRIRFYLQDMWSFWKHPSKEDKRTPQNYGVLMLPSEY